MKWFKFYGQDFQTDPKIGFLNTPQKLMWVNLLCIASQDESHSGVVKFLSEDHLKTLSGITSNPFNDDWEQSKNTFQVFIDLGLIEMPDEYTIIIPKFKEKQDTNLTDAERAKRYRESKKNKAKSDERHAIVTEPSRNRHTRLDKTRLDKIKKNDTPKGVSQKESANSINPQPAVSDSLPKGIKEMREKLKGKIILNGFAVLIFLFAHAPGSHAATITIRTTVSARDVKKSAFKPPVSHKAILGVPSTKDKIAGKEANMHKHWTDKEIARYIKSKSWPYETAIRLAKSENFWNKTRSFNCSRIGGPNKDGSYDTGIFQINSIHAPRLARLGMTLEDMKDCKKNIDYAHDWLYKFSGFNPWSAYKNGSYLSHVPIDL